jgi:hypothetical protein
VPASEAVPRRPQISRAPASQGGIPSTVSAGTHPSTVNVPSFAECSPSWGPINMDRLHRSLIVSLQSGEQPHEYGAELLPRFGGVQLLCERSGFGHAATFFSPPKLSSHTNTPRRKTGTSTGDCDCLTSQPSSKA